MNKPPSCTLSLVFQSEPGSAPLVMTTPLSDDIADYRFSTRTVEELKLGLLGGPEPLQTAVEVMRRRQFRKDLFMREAERLGALLAERMEDAEGWHDRSRVLPARKQLGGDWP